MYAQIIHSETTPEQRPELDRIVSAEMMPALQEQAGCAGTLSLVDHHNGEAILIVLWETSEQARRPVREYSQRFRDALTRFVAISTGSRYQVALWEVNARV